MNPKTQHIINTLASLIGRLVLWQNDDKEQARIIAEMKHFVNSITAPGVRTIVHEPEEDDEL